MNALLAIRRLILKDRVNAGTNGAVGVSGPFPPIGQTAQQ